jgi:hypothetical protein
MPDKNESFKKYDRLSHTSALGELFIADEWKKVQAEIKKMHECEVWFEPGRRKSFLLEPLRLFDLPGVSWKTMKKQASDQSFHDRRYQERKRAEAAKKAAPKKVVRESSREGSPAKQDSGVAEE